MRHAHAARPRDLVRVSCAFSHSTPFAFLDFRAQGVGSALLYAAPCRLYVSRLYRNEFALSFGGDSLLLLQASSGADAQDWVVALAACLFFSSAAFEAVLAECRRFFDAAHKTVSGRLSFIEALDLVRAMGRDITYTQVLTTSKDVAPESGGWLGIREFTYLVRSVCADADPRAELLRAFRLLDTSTVGAVSEVAPSSHEGLAPATHHSAASDGYLSVADLTSTMRAAGVPDDHVMMVIRAAGADLHDERIPYARLADALYPAAATAAKRKRAQLSEAAAKKEATLENNAREKWEAQRAELVQNAAVGAPDDGALPLFLSPTAAPAPSATSGPPIIPPLGLSRVASAEPRIGYAPNRSVSSQGAELLTPRRQEIVRSMTMDSSTSMPATPRTIADRVQRARRASEVSRLKSANRINSGESASKPGSLDTASQPVAFDNV